jgi:hypothetical protein
VTVIKISIVVKEILLNKLLRYTLIAVLTKKSSGSIELVAYHKVRRIFLSLAEIQKEDPQLVEIYEFNGENFRLIAK